MQARIQSEILRRLAEITTIRQVPKRSFEAFARTRYEREITELVQAGQIPQEEIEKLTEQSVVEEHLQQNHEQLVGEYRTVVALDEIYEREGLEVDEELVQSQARDTLKDAKKSGATGATVRARGHCCRDVPSASCAHILRATVQHASSRCALMCKPLTHGLLALCLPYVLHAHADAQYIHSTGRTLQLRAATEYVRNEARSLSVMAFLQQHVKLNIKPLEN